MSIEIHNFPHTKHWYNNMHVNEVVMHKPYGCNWRFTDCNKNSRSGNRKVRIKILYHYGKCAVISPISGQGKDIHYLCNTDDLRKLK